MDADTIALTPPGTGTGRRPSAGNRPGPEPVPPVPDGRPGRPWGQRAAALATAAVCAAAAAWYIPRVISEDSRMLTGTVTSSGVVELNFDKPGYLVSVDVFEGEAVKQGQVLAAEYAPAGKALLAADQAAITSDQVKLAEIEAAPVVGQQADVAAAKAQLAKDEAQLVADRTSAAATRILAPSAGTIVAVNGQPGEIVTTEGIRTGTTSSEPARAAQDPLFSLLPEGPQTSGRPTGTATALPVIALRTSTTWHVDALVPESEVAQIRTGQQATITVPDDNIANIHGQIEEVLPTPVFTSAGIAYQAVVSVAGHEKILPLDGMAADVQISS